MSLNLIRCDRCGLPVEYTAWNTGVFHRCPCGANLYARTYPLLESPLAGGRAGSDLSAEDQSCCFYHPQKQAVVACDTCGRFLCDLCDLAAGARHVCGQCFARAMNESTDDQFCSRRPTHDQAALTLAIIPLTAPLGIYHAIRHHNSPGSVLGVRKGLMAAALIVGLINILLLAYFVFKLLEVSVSRYPVG